MDSSTHTSARNPFEKVEAVVLSGTGRWVMPHLVDDFTTDSRQGWTQRAELGLRLGVRNAELLKLIWATVERVVQDGQDRTVLLPATLQQAARLVLIRPAREPGYAVLKVECIATESPAPATTLLVALFALTPTEADIALALMRGDETSDIAAARGGSIETVRGHVKSLLRKTGLTSQRQLAAMLTRIGMLSNREQPQTSP